MDQHLILAFLWIIYVVLHSVLASVSVKNYLREKLKQSFLYYRLFYTVFAFAGLVFIVRYLIQMESRLLWQREMITTSVGALLGVVGAVMMMVCIRKYFFSLSGLKSLYQEEEKAELMITGIHQHLRHPLYLGTFAFIWGFWMIYPLLSLLITNLVITIYTLIGIRLEEKKLIDEFGDAYRDYQKKVPMLLPSFKKKLSNG